jgi:hypothetical protein
LAEIESAYVYLFDCFPKSKDQSKNQSKNKDMILKLRNLTDVDPLIDPTLEIDHTVDEMTTTATDNQTGKRVILKTADLFRIENGMIVDHWDVVDASGMA